MSLRSQQDTSKENYLFLGSYTSSKGYTLKKHDTTCIGLEQGYITNSHKLDVSYIFTKYEDGKKNKQQAAVPKDTANKLGDLFGPTKNTGGQMGVDYL